MKDNLQHTLELESADEDSNSFVDAEVIKILPTGEKFILDVCCGPKMMWFDKNNPNTIYMDNRVREKGFREARPNREVKPDMMADFRAMPFNDESFLLVVMDPPHLFGKGEFFNMAEDFGYLTKETWFMDIRKGIAECYRVLKVGGVLIFKWNESSIKRTEVLAAIKWKPLFGHPVQSKIPTHWFTFMKTDRQ